MEFSVQTVFEGEKVLVDFRSRGFIFTVMGDKVRVAPRLPPDLRAEAAKCKAVLRAILRAEADAESPRQDDDIPRPAVHVPVGWLHEYQLERSLLCQRLARCTDPAVRVVLAALKQVEPETETQWIALGEVIFQTEATLRGEGRLPAAE